MIDDLYNKFAYVQLFTNDALTRINKLYKTKNNKEES